MRILVKFAGELEVELEEKILANRSAFSLEEEIIEPSSAEGEVKEQSLQLLFTFLVSVRKAWLPFGYDKLLGFINSASLFSFFASMIR